MCATTNGCPSSQEWSEAPREHTGHTSQISSREQWSRDSTLCGGVQMAFRARSLRAASGGENTDSGQEALGQREMNSALRTRPTCFSEKVKARPSEMGQIDAVAGAFSLHRPSNSKIPSSEMGFHKTPFEFVKPKSLCQYQEEARVWWKDLGEAGCPCIYPCLPSATWATPVAEAPPCPRAGRLPGRWSCCQP